MKPSYTVKICMIFLFCLEFAYSANDNTLPDKRCTDNEKLGIIYLNGVLNNNFIGGDVDQSVKRIRKILSNKTLAGASYENTCINFLYNKTEGIFDFVESLAQKVREEKEAKGLSFSWEEVSDYLLSKRPLDVFAYDQELAGQIEEFSLEQNVEFLKQEILTQEAVTLDQIASKMASVINAEKIDGTKMIRPSIVVSHSQGNLFANLLYEKLKAKPDLIPTDILNTKFANLQIASAASIVKTPIGESERYTSTDDLVIKGARLLFPETLSENIKIFSMDKEIDLLGHSFTSIYTNDEIYGSFDNTVISNVIYPYQTLIDSTGPTPLYYDDYSKAEINGVVVNIISDPRFKKMSDIFYEKLNNLAKQVYPFGSCSSSSWDDLKALGLDIEFHRDINGNITSYGVFRMVNGQKSYEDIYKSDFLLSVQYKKPFSSVIYSAEIGKPGELLSSELSDVLNSATWIYLNYAGNYSYADDTVTPIQSNCKIFPYRISDLDINVGLLEYGLISTIRINKGSDYTSIKVFESETDDNASPIGVPVELFSWRNDSELPQVIQNGTNEYSFQVQSKINKAIIVEICNYFKCSNNRVNVSLPKIVVHKSIHDDVGDMSPGVDILNTPPVRPQDDFTYNYSFGDSGDVSFILRGMRAPYGGTIYNWYTTYTCGTYDETIGGWSGFSYTIPWRASQETDLLSGGNLNSDGYISNIEREVIVDIFYPESENVSIEPMQFTFSELSCFQ